MNNRSAKGVRRFDLDDLLDNGADGDFFISESKDAVWIIIPGSGHTRWPIKEPLENGALWKWDGNEDAPTLTPSLHLVGQWHGWMKNGELVSC
jgi:hypothetical protein